MVNFRPQGDKVEERYEELRKQYQSLTGHTSENKVLNYAVNLAHEKLQETNDHENEAKNTRVRAANFEK